MDATELLQRFDSVRDWQDFMRVFSQFSNMTFLTLDASRTLKWMQAAFEEMGRQNIRSYAMADVIMILVRRVDALEAELIKQKQT